MKYLKTQSSFGIIKKNIFNQRLKIKDIDLTLFIEYSSIFNNFFLIV